MFCFVGSAAGEKKLKGLSIELVSETRTVVPGQPFTVGLHIEHDEGFHTYWQNPGIVGLATHITWQLPEGFTASEIQWPYPELTKMVGHPCHGYQRDVTLLVTIKPPDQIREKEVTLEVATGWMCCADTCHPGEKNLSLTLRVAAETLPDRAGAALIRKSRGEIPQVSEAWSGAAITGRNERVIQLKVNPPLGLSSEAVYLFSCDGQISSDKKQTVNVQSDGTWLLTTERSEFSPKNSSQLRGVLKVGNLYIILQAKYPDHP